jgi:hypothetical protein
MKKQGIFDQNSSLGKVIDRFEGPYFLKPQDFKSTHGTYIGKTFPEIPDQQVRRLKNWGETHIHPGLAAALKYWERVAPRPPPEKRKKDPEKGHSKRKRTRIR